MKFDNPTIIRFEPGLREAIAAAAEKDRTKPSEWMRRALRQAVHAQGIALPPVGDDADRFRCRGQRFAAP